MKALCMKNFMAEGNRYDLEIEQHTLECIACKNWKEAQMLFLAGGGLKEPCEGTVTVFGRELYRMEPEERALFRRRNVGMIAAHNNLISGMSFYENLVLSIQLDGRQADLALAEKLVSMADIKVDWAQMPGNLPVPIQQKAAMIRCVLAGTSLLLMRISKEEEPWAVRENMHFLKYIQEEYDLTAVVFGENEII